MVSKRVIVGIGFLILAAGILGFAWTQWASSDFDPSTDGRYDQSIYKNLDPSFSREHQRGRLVSAARKNPGFGGAFLSKRETVLNIYIVQDENNPEKWEETRQALEELLDAESGLQLNVIKGDYTIAQLSEWYDLMESEGVWDQGGVHVIDLDEGGNKLYVGVTSHYDVAGVEAFLDRISVPRKAVTIAVTEPPTNASHALQQAAYRDS